MFTETAGQMLLSCQKHAAMQETNGEFAIIC